MWTKVVLLYNAKSQYIAYMAGPSQGLKIWGGGTLLCFFKFVSQAITQKAVHQISDPENKKCSH